MQPRTTPSPAVLRRRLTGLGVLGPLAGLALAALPRASRLRRLTALLAPAAAATALVASTRLRRTLERRDAERRALQQAADEILGELSLDAALQTVVDQARQLLDARYGALSVVDVERLDAGAGDAIRTFVTSGIDRAHADRIGAPPSGRGVLGVGLRDGQRLRLDRIQDHPRSAGFPANHPPMQTLLAVPVAGRGGYRGNLYVADKRDGQPFSIDDEDVLARFAVQAAIALDNAWLHAQVRGLTVAEERLRLARELHDGQAQVLAAVNMQAQVVTELLRQQRLDDARDVLDRLAQLARSVLTDVREGIVGLRAVGRPGDDLATMLRRHVETWRDHQADLAVTLDLPAQLPELDPSVALQLLRIVQEALANVRKHARATRVAIGAEARTGGLALTVVDDGVGFDPAQLALHRGRPRFGLAILRERAEAIGAQLDVRSQPGAGTTVAVSYDVASAATAARAT